MALSLFPTCLSFHDFSNMFSLSYFVFSIFFVVVILSFFFFPLVFSSDYCVVQNVVRRKS